MFTLASELDAAFGLDHRVQTHRHHGRRHDDFAELPARREYTPARPRFVLGLAAIAMTAITFGVLIALPATLETADADADVAAAPATMISAAFAATR